MTNTPVVVTPLHLIEHRYPEAGRIRLGVKTDNPKFPFKSIDTFRFTSPDRVKIEQLAALYGGEVKPWSDERAKVKNQWEVISEAKRIPVLLPSSEALDCAYEQWSGGGRMRRCDGITCIIPAEDGEMEVDCLCVEQGKRQCDPKTRLDLFLPDVNFGGVWRYTSGGENAAVELPAMEHMLQQLKVVGIVQAIFTVTRRETMANGKKRSFVVPGLELVNTPMEILTRGAGTIEEIGREQVRAVTSAPPPVAAITTGEPLITKTGKVLSDADVEALADEAERGYDVSHLKAKILPLRRPLEEVYEDGSTPEDDVAEAELVEDAPSMELARLVSAVTAADRTGSLDPDDPGEIVRFLAQHRKVDISNGVDGLDPADLAKITVPLHDVLNGKATLYRAASGNLIIRKVK